MHAIWCTVDGLLDSLVFPSEFHIFIFKCRTNYCEFCLVFFGTFKLGHGFLGWNWSKIQKKSCTFMRVQVKEWKWMNESVWCATNECVEILQSLMPKRWEQCEQCATTLFFCHLMDVWIRFDFFFSLFAKTICNGAAEHIYSVFSCSCKKSENHKMTASLSRVVLLWKAINEIEYDALDNYYYGAAFNCHWGLFSHCQYHHI